MTRPCRRGITRLAQVEDAERWGYRQGSRRWASAKVLIIGPKRPL